MIKGSVGVLAAGDQFHAPAVNTIATVTLDAPTNGSWVVAGVSFGFDLTPAASVDFTIESPAATALFTVPVGIAGVQNQDFDPPLRFPMGEAVKINLPAGGASQSGYVNFKSAWVE